MSPRITFKPYKRVTPNWLGTKITDPKVVIPGGILLSPTAFPLVNNKRFAEGGTFVGRTFAERDAGTGYGIADPATDEQFAILLHDVDLSEEDIAAAIQPNAANVIYENLLPGWATLSAAVRTRIRSLYHCLTAHA